MFYLLFCTVTTVSASLDFSKELKAEYATDLVRRIREIVGCPPRFHPFTFWAIVSLLVSMLQLLSMDHQC